MLAILLLFFIFSACLADELNYDLESKLLFPEINNWQLFSKLKLIDKSKFTEIMPHLKTAYLSSEIAKKYDGGSSCSFISRTLNNNSKLEFYCYDIDGDSIKDVIYNGNAHCAEGHTFLIWKGKKDGTFSIMKNSFWSVKAIAFQYKHKLLICSFKGACCGGMMDEYYLGHIGNIRQKGTIRVHIYTEQPKDSVIQPIHFTNENKTILRSSPKIDDEYDISSSHRECTAVFGNIISKFLGGASGKILAKHQDVNSRNWAYIIFDQNADPLRYHSPYPADVGWIELQLAETAK